MIHSTHPHVYSQVRNWLQAHIPPRHPVSTTIILTQISQNETRDGSLAERARAAVAIGGSRKGGEA